MTVRPKAQPGLVLAGFVVLWLVLDRSAALLGSYRGELGLIVCLIVLVLALGIEMRLSRASLGQALGNLGLGRSNAAGLFWSVALCVAMLGFYPVFSALTGAELKLRPDWLLLLPGLSPRAALPRNWCFAAFCSQFDQQNK